MEIDMNIDVELFRLIKKYDIYHWMPEVEEIYKKDFCRQLTKELFQSLPKGKKIALRGAGKHTEEILACLTEEEKKKITYFIDSNVYCKKEGYTVIDPTQILNYAIDIIIISSHRFKVDFMRELLNLHGNYQIIDIYDYFAENGMICTKEFYLYDSVPFMHKTYVDVNNTLKMYEEDYVGNKKIYLQKLIAECIEIKDFLHAFQYIDEYISKGWDENNRFSDFKKDLNILFHDMKSKLKETKRKNIIINWVDNVSNDEFCETEFAQKRIKDSCVFKNAYTNTPWTHFTQNIMFLGKLPIEDKTYLTRHYDEENSEILALLKKYGYQFTYIANPGMFQNSFSDEHLVHHPKEFMGEILGERAISECSTRLQWISLKQMLATEKSVCHLIHNLAEVHIPFIYTDIEEVSDDKTHYTQRSRYKKGGLHFLTKQIDWYSQFYNMETCQIYLADHGDMPYIRAYEKGRTNIPLIIKAPHFQPEIEERLYSHLHFSKMLQIILTEEWEKWDEIFDGYVQYENLDFYNANAIRLHVTKWMTGGSPIDMANFQLRGIRTKEDLYVIYSIGKELYFRLPDEKTNLISEEKWKERIEYLRKICPAEFIDIKKEPLFKDSHLLYDFLRMMPEEEIPW